MVMWNPCLLFTLTLLLPLIAQCRWTPERQHRSIDTPSGRDILRNGLGSKEDAILETFKHNLIRYYGVSPSFAEQFKVNLRKAIQLEMHHLQANRGRGGYQGLEPGKKPRQLDEDDDEEEAPTTTTQGPSPISIINGVYGILTGLGSFNPDRVLQSTANFFPPSQQQTADALISSALGKNPGTWPTTTPTTTKLTTTTKDPDDYDYDEDATTVKSGAVTVAPTAAGQTVAVPVTSAPVVAATVATASG